MPDHKESPIPMSQGSSSPKGWFTFIIDFLRTLFRLFVSENRRREADFDEIRKMTNVDYQEDEEMAKSEKPQSKHINPVANGGDWAQPADGLSTRLSTQRTAIGKRAMEASQRVSRNIVQSKRATLAPCEGWFLSFPPHGCPSTDGEGTSLE